MEGKNALKQRWRNLGRLRTNFVGWCLMFLDPRYGTWSMSVTLRAHTNFVDASIKFGENFASLL